MVLPVEDGGFVSFSTSRCRKCLNLLILPFLNKEIPMKISPWNQYQFAGQEAKHNIQLTFKKLRVSQRCVSLIHFLRSCMTIKRMSSLNLGVKGTANSAPCCVAAENESKLRLKSCLKKQSKDCCSSDVQVDNLSNHCDGIKRVHWPDSRGKEIAVVEHANDRRCQSVFPGCYICVQCEVAGQYRSGQFNHEVCEPPSCKNSHNQVYCVMLNS